MKERYYSDFKLGEYRLSDFSGIRYNPGDIVGGTLPSPRHTTIDLPNIHGSQYFKTTYDSKLITVPVFIYDEIDIERFYAWICKDGQQTFTFIDENGALDYKEIDVVYNQGINFTEYFYQGFKGTTEIEFIAHHPLWRIRDEKKERITNLVIGGQNKFSTKTTVESKPIIKITPNGNQDIIKFTFNNLIITLTNVDKDIYINSRDGEVYEIDNGIRVSAFGKYYSNGWMELPTIKPFISNTISLISGSIRTMEITPNSQILY